MVEIDVRFLAIAYDKYDFKFSLIKLRLSKPKRYVYMYGWITSMKIDFYYGYVPLFGLATATAVESMAIGFILCLLVEIPFVSLQKKLMNALHENLRGRSSVKENPREKQEQNLINESIGPEK